MQIIDLSTATGRHAKETLEEILAALPDDRACCFRGHVLDDIPEVQAALAAEPVGFALRMPTLPGRLVMCKAVHSDPRVEQGTLLDVEPNRRLTFRTSGRRVIVIGLLRGKDAFIERRIEEARLDAAMHGLTKLQTLLAA
jgi:hypothetical protein